MGMSFVSFYFFFVFCVGLLEKVCVDYRLNRKAVNLEKVVLSANDEG